MIIYYYNYVKKKQQKAEIKAEAKFVIFGQHYGSGGTDLVVCNDGVHPCSLFNKLAKHLSISNSTFKFETFHKSKFEDRLMNEFSV